MNLHQIASGAIATVNPFISVLWRLSSGFTTDASMRQVPAYTNVAATLVQLQPLTSGNLRHMESLNISGTVKAIYMNSNARSVVRSLARGGDLFEFGGERWLVVAEFELWPDWCKVGIQLQGKVA